jgi:hypothetical protein
MLPPHESYEYLLIDGDAIPYLIGWHHRDHNDSALVKQAVDIWMQEFFTVMQRTKYIGVIAPDNAKCFRKELYLYKPYKGNRTKEDWMTVWEPTIRQHLVDKWNFVKAPVELETDDVIAYLGTELVTRAIICSPDKDLKQIPGAHYDYRKATTSDITKSLIEIISSDVAERRFWVQMMTGDTTDNINGITGVGEARANKLLSETNNFFWQNTVLNEYIRVYGPHYGTIIYHETYACVKMMIPSHPFWPTFGKSLNLDYYLSKLTNTDDRSVYQEVK